MTRWRRLFGRAASYVDRSSGGIGEAAATRGAVRGGGRVEALQQGAAEEAGQGRAGEEDSRGGRATPARRALALNSFEHTHDHDD